MLNTHLSTSAVRQSARDEALVEAMKSLHLQYDGPDWVAKVIRQLIELVQDEATSNAGGNAITDWSELLTVKPKTYLQMSMALDMSMSSGRFPDKERLMARLPATDLLHLQQNPAGNGPPPPLIAQRVVVEEELAGRSSRDPLRQDQATASSSADANPPDYTTTTCDDFSSYQSAVDMNALFDSTLVDFGLDAGFAVNAVGMDGSQM